MRTDSQAEAATNCRGAELRETMVKQIGKYTISERIGRGTYSRVYRAVESQGQPVAIKVSTTQTEPEQLDEFQKDLVAAASVLHPNLVAVHDLAFEDDFPYLVMELQRRAQGTVRFQATIGTDGSLTNVRLLSGDPLLNVAAKQALLQWKYHPATLNGEPVEVTQTIVVRFNPVAASRERG